MDFTLDEEQEALRDAVRGLLKGYDPSIDADRRRQVTAEDPGFDEGLWARLAEMGLLGLPFDEADGGMGAGPVEVAVVCEEITAKDHRTRVGRSDCRVGTLPGRR